MHKMEELRDMLCEELDSITSKGELSAGSLDIVDKLTHSIKSIDTIMAMEEAGSGTRYGASGRTRNVSRDSRGRYADGYGGYNYRDQHAGRVYHGDAKMDLIDQLRDMESVARDDETRRMVQKWIKQVEQD